MSNLTAKINKETFKLAIGECIKKAWVWDKKTNFISALKWNNLHQLTFDVSAELEDEAEYDQSAQAVDLFDAYLSPKNIEDVLFDNAWEEAWASETGFNPSMFLGETIEDGLAFGELVKQYFDMQLIQNNATSHHQKQSYDFSDLHFDDAEMQTKEVLTNCDVEFLYEAAFSYNQQKIKTRCDVLKIKPNKHVEIYEAKATTKVKKEHFFDLVYQAYVLEKCGFTIDNIFIVRINPDYVLGWNYNQIRVGQDLGSYAKEVEQSYGRLEYEEIKVLIERITDISPNSDANDIDLQDFIIIDSLTWGKKDLRLTLYQDFLNLKKQVNLDELFSTISAYLSLGENNEEIPEFLKAKKCVLKLEKTKSGWYFNAMTSEIDDCFHVMPWFDKTKPGFWTISKFKRSFKSEVIRNSKSPYFADYDSLFDSDIRLNQKQLSYFEKNQLAQRIFEVYKKQQDNPTNHNQWNIVNHKYEVMINELLAKYDNFPVYMYDFETVKWAIPRFNLTNSYFQTPFQYSIDVLINQEYDYNSPSSMPHYSFLSNEVNVDPRPKFIENFIKDCFKHGPGVYVAYNQSFEKGVLRKLALFFPEYAKPLLYISQNTIDLMDFFSGNLKQERPPFLIYHPDFKGSYSIKKTQPALDESFSYKDLVINKGDKASETFRKFIDGRIPIKAWELQIKDGMFKYCDRDTLAMVVILKRIKEIIKEHKNE